MCDRRPTSPFLPIAVTLTVLLLGLYLGVYYWLVIPLPDNAGTRPFVWYFHDSMPDDSVTFFAWQDRLERFFAPMHWLDRRIRPHVWQPRP